MLDVHELVKKEEFYYSDLIYIKGSGFLEYTIANNGLVFNKKNQIKGVELTDIFANSTSESNGSIYVCGECSAHSSCGFFYKKTNENIDWFLMSLEFGPFVNIIKNDREIRFLSEENSGFIVLNNNELDVKNKFLFDMKLRNRP
ncbi:hypothetical protein [Pectobacterium versatile]|uniref:hypothetical protein n=1 Tax=Pectobacterium versatile TaxID=2488639 RepID=UPI000F654CFE|nr:hypothetical protein [Pectobacterium versatile]AZK64776.1 hypothetical protein EIP93_22070 [Pectobacterium versatile]TAI79888.1 hypothetical protein EG330_22575 [Pectobacterium versatile]